MLNELLTWVLNTYLGKYLEDFNPAQLSIALASGEVELENVPIRKDALRSFGIPVEAISGSIGKIKLQIPVRQFRTSPWCIIIERVYGIFGPKDLNDWDNEKEKQNEYKYKLNILDAKETNWRLENDCNVENYYCLSYSSWINYGASLATNILENLELKLIDVHLRYEDTLSIPDTPFSAGIRIQSISVQTCGSSWLPGSKNNDINNVSYKLLEVKDFCLYWDKLLESSTCSTFSSKDLLVNMNDLCQIENHKFIINPINATAKFKRERCKKAIRTKDRARMCCDVVIPELIVILHEEQYKEIVKCISFLKDTKRKRSLKISRPHCNIADDVKIWWKYAAKCYGLIVCTVEEKWKVAKENIRYINIYKRILMNPSESLSKEDKLFKIEMEKDRSLDDLVFLREISCKSVLARGLNIRNQKLNPGRSILYHWFPNFLGWYGNTASTNNELYEKIEDDILNAIKESIENETFPNRDAIFANITFSLSDGRLSLTHGRNTQDAVALEMEFYSLSSFIEVKPKLSSYCIGISLGFVSLKDTRTELTEFPYIIRPQTQSVQESKNDNFMGLPTKNDVIDFQEPWFQLQYEKNPIDQQSDYRLTINSKSFDVVYNESVFKWLVSFFTKPVNDLNRDVSFTTKRRHFDSRLKFLKNWKSMLIGQKDYRKKWSFEINISAPRIICVENFKEKNTSVLVIDFGRFQLFKNDRNSKTCDVLKEDVDDPESEDELFMTPCSTPPGSKISSVSPSAITPTSHEMSMNSNIFINKDTGLENNLHSEIYDKYVINLTDMQVLVCKKLECSSACMKISSSFHLLDKFNISIQLERRVVNTYEPEYPAITVFGNLNQIVAHISEQKIAESLRILNGITLDLYKQYSDISQNNVSYGEIFLDENNDAVETSNAIIFQFIIGHVILEVQSKEKSIAELQIIGTKTEISKKTGEVNISMSVHGFLLVDAIQSFGHDFELLIASHRNIKIDSISGSIKQNKPCSPTSTGFVEPKEYQQGQTSPCGNTFPADLPLGKDGPDDALITIEIHIAAQPDDEHLIQIINITFNNLDVIANQETIVELLAVGKRIVDNYKLYSSYIKNQDDKRKSTGQKDTMGNDHFKTEINFDFHRLNILVLRKAIVENEIVGRKVGTLTMVEVRIHAEMEETICVGGALGGIQIMDITPEGLNHQRIFSVGMDPLTDAPKIFKTNSLSSVTSEMHEMHDDVFQIKNALNFKITQIKNSNIVVKIRMASVWYTHCPRFIEEIYLCFNEFMQYLKNFIKSIRNKASDMAKGLVHHISSTRIKNNSQFENISFDVILNTPVLVLPRSCGSTEVIVANLGKITVYNTYENTSHSQDVLRRDVYFIDIRNVNVSSLTTTEGEDLRYKLPSKPYKIYSRESNAGAILCDTAFLFECNLESRQSEEADLKNIGQTIFIQGSVTESFKICLSRSQYEQLKDSLNYATDIMFSKEGINKAESNVGIWAGDVAPKTQKPNKLKKISVQFSVPIFKLDLKNDENLSLIHITFQEFSFHHSHVERKKEVLVLLRSVLMEDLCTKNSKYKNMVDSSTDIDSNKHILRNNFSISCPNVSDLASCDNFNKFSSIPSNLNDVTKSNMKKYALSKNILGKINFKTNQNMKTKNLVIYKSTTTENVATDIPDKIESTIDFNSLNLTVSIEKWFMVLDFFGFVTSTEKNSDVQRIPTTCATENIIKTELQVSIRSLNLILIRGESELSKVNISCVILHINKANMIESIDGKLGSVSLRDLTPYGCLYRERFSTSGAEALSFTYKRANSNEGNCIHSLRSLEKDANLLIFMSSVRYIHTKRFIVELNLFLKELLQLQSPVLKKFTTKEESYQQKRSAVKMGLEIHADSPIVLLPESYNSNRLLIADLGKFTLTNSFHCAHDLSSFDEKHTDLMANNEIVELMHIDLVNINFQTGERENKNDRTANKTEKCNIFHVGNFIIVKLGSGIFKEKCRLKLEVLRNTESDISHNIPDIKVRGTLSELHGLINLEQYKLIRGFFHYNLGETIDDVYHNFKINPVETVEAFGSKAQIYEDHSIQSNWSTLSLNFLLENVIISLTESLQVNNLNLNSTFACIKFIKSTLDINLFIDGSQDIDLISNEIIIMDARDHFSESTKNNVFKYILLSSSQNALKSSVQAEIHSRTRNNTSKHTILLNNMRIMVILDYFDKLYNFLGEGPYMTLEGKNIGQEKLNNTRQESQSNDYEFLLNITNSEIVFLENNDQLDTNAIILKSTTIYSYRPNNTIVPLSIDINHLEIFSCILGSENETSQSIIDPFTLNMELRSNCLQVQIQNKIFLQISYHDIMLLSRILQSILTYTNRHVVQNSHHYNDFEKIAPLVAMGFKHAECWMAMEVNKFNVNKAAIWLRQQENSDSNFALEINSIALTASSVAVCIIDDCLDADVPLLEVALLNVMVNQKLRTKEKKGIKCYEGEVNAVIASDYYNRRLSGWEPIIEPWQCIALWNYSTCTATKSKCLSLQASSKQILKLNITSTLLELYGLVHKNWTADYLKRCSYKSDNGCENTNSRQRLPFVPFALKNLTGEPLVFKMFSQADAVTRTDVRQQQDLLSNWISAQNNEVIPFDFGSQSKLRHMDSHKLNVHQILVQIHGWTLIGPISVDKVGTFFRYASKDNQHNKKTRIVLEISLVGSAQKFIIVRSALNIVNKTASTFLLRMKLKNEKESIFMTINSLEKVFIPLRFVDASIYFKPKSIAKANTNIGDDNCFCTCAVLWKNCITNDCMQNMHSCFSINKLPFHVLTEIKKDNYPVREIISMPGHTVSIIPPFKLKNLLCCDLLFKIIGHTQGRLSPAEEIEIYSIDINESFSLSITLDNYKLSGRLKIPMGHTGIVEPKLKLVDALNRELFLRISIQSFQGKGMEVYIAAPVWIINKTGLPLIFRQEGINLIASGQFEEHEHAREVSPLLFSFSDQEGSPFIEFRLGKSFGSNNKWCTSFGIHKETNSRELMTEQSRFIYIIGINVKRGIGLYSCTTFITLTPRFQLYNTSKYKLEFAQKCDINNAITSTNKVLLALPGCNFPFHWPNSEQEPLLCVRVADDASSNWSSGLPVNEAKSLYINIRNKLGEMIFLRLEIVLHGGTYLLNFTCANNLPPPIRIDNYSEVSIYFTQKGIMPQWGTNVKPQSSLAYVLDDPLGPQTLLLEAPGGNLIEHKINKINGAKSLTYPNFIYIAFKDTFRCVFTENNKSVGLEGQQLVLGVKDRRVVITRKRTGDRSQLWLMNSYGQLEHEGSSPPTEYLQPTRSSPRLVLDLEKPPNPRDYTRLVVRPQNTQRATTQTWRFENGRLMCHASMCVQAANGLYGLQPGFDAVLGRIHASLRTPPSNRVPFEQHIEIQKLRPGSGHLDVTNKMDGPIKCIQIHDVKTNCKEIVLAQDPLWNHVSVFNKAITDGNKFSNLEELSITLMLTKGVGISLVTRSPCEELAYISLEDIVLNIILLPSKKSIDLKIGELQVDNQLLDAQCPIVLHSCKSNSENINGDGLVFKTKLLQSPNKNAVIFKCFILKIKPCTVILEERFLLKTALFLNLEAEEHLEDEGAYNHLYRIHEYPFSKNAKRFYFDECVIGSTQIRLSVLTSSKLSPELLEIKKSLGLIFIKFEDAVIELEKFSNRHHFETLEVYIKALKAHYFSQLKWHAASILGSVDFLGNPLGFANDLSEGVSGLIFEGSVKSLVKNVTHGLSNSTAKLTETLSDSLGRVVLDEHDNETRQKILETSHHTSVGHLAAGLKGFAFGLLGGVTSIVRHTYVGAQSDGFPGFFSGLGRGIVGTVTRPLIGVLDLASETASAVRETSRGSHHYLPDRKRLPRCVTGASGGLLPVYSYRQSKGQQYLYIINGRNFAEKLISYEPNLCNDKAAHLRLLVSTEYVRVFSRCEDEPAIMFECHLSEVLSCHPLITNSTSSKTLPTFYIEISTNVPKVTRPRVRCQSEEIAEKASRCINCAKADFDERELSVGNF